ncbi:MAG: tetratricopeptide repeat protein [Anaerolineales bacterium]|nr:tetratricopeptide repeat protein [Anaerolineales bacterium]
MSTDTPKQLTEAIAAARVGDRHRAREILSRLLRSDSSNAEYWIWMSAVVDSPKERVYCLESALKVDPTNRSAMRGLVILGAREPSDRELSQAIKVPRRDIDPIQPALQPSKIESVEEQAEPKPKPSTFLPKRGQLVLRFVTTTVIVGGAALLLAGVIYIIFPRIPTGFIGAASTLPPASPTSTETPLPGTPTATPIPAATRIIRTPVSTEFAATPLALLVERTATATPLAGYTPHPSFEAYQAGVDAIDEGDYEQAIFFLDQVIDTHPDWIDAHYLRGKALRLLGRIGSAITSQDQALNQNQEFAPALLERGRALMSRDEDAAQRDLEEAVKLEPGFTEAYEELGTFYQERRLWQRLENRMEVALEAGTRSPRILFLLSDAKLNLGKVEEGLAYAIESSADDPTSLEGYLAVGRAYVEMSINSLDDSYYSQALWPLQTYVAYRPGDYHGWGYLGRAQLGIGEIDEALHSLNISLELNDRYARAYLARGILYTALGRYEDALSDLNNARRFGSETFDLQIATARVQFHTGQYTAALNENLQPAVQESKEITSLRLREMRLAEAYALRALIYETNPEVISDAIRHWRWILDFEHVIPETRALAEQHYNELIGEGPTRTPTSSPTASPSPGPTTTPNPAEITPSPTPGS